MAAGEELRDVPPRPFVSAISGIKADSPAFTRSHKLLTVAARSGFKWPNAESVLGKIAEELEEVKKAAASKDKAHITEEIGDVLSAVVTLVVFTETPPEVLVAPRAQAASAQGGDPLTRIDEGLAHLKAVVSSADREPLRTHIGGLLAAVGAFAASEGIDPEAALQKTNDKFATRFDAVERALHAQGKTMATTPLKEMIGVWNAQKPAAAITTEPQFARK